MRTEVKGTLIQENKKEEEEEKNNNTTNFCGFEQNDQTLRSTVLFKVLAYS